MGKLDALCVSEVSDKRRQDGNSICLHQLFRKGGCSRHRRIDQENCEDLPPIC